MCDVCLSAVRAPHVTLKLGEKILRFDHSELGLLLRPERPRPTDTSATTAQTQCSTFPGMIPVLHPKLDCFGVVLGSGIAVILIVFGHWDLILTCALRPRREAEGPAACGMAACQSGQPYKVCAAAWKDSCASIKPVPPGANMRSMAPKHLPLSSTKKAALRCELHVATSV